MGFKINNGTAADVKDAVAFLLGDDAEKVASTTLAVRTKDGIDEVFYLDEENGRILVTGESFYSNGKKSSPKAKPAGFSAAERKKLADLYDALVGVVSECGVEYLDSFHKRGGAAMLTDLETLLRKYAPAEFAAVAG